MGLKHHHRYFILHHRVRKRKKQSKKKRHEGEGEATQDFFKFKDVSPVMPSELLTGGKKKTSRRVKI